jgi:hypothetical protein
MGIRTNTLDLSGHYDLTKSGQNAYVGSTLFFAWGRGYEGQLAQNDIAPRSSPVQIPGTSWSSISASRHSLATKTDGTLWSWGYNSQGQLGQNNATPRSSPVQIPGTTWSSVGKTSTALHSTAIKTDGTLWVWGYNNVGQLGQNDRTYRSSPVQIPGTAWSSANTGNRVPLALQISS